MRRCIRVHISNANQVFSHARTAVHLSATKKVRTEYFCMMTEAALLLVPDIVSERWLFQLQTPRDTVPGGTVEPPQIPEHA